MCSTATLALPETLSPRRTSGEHLFLWVSHMTRKTSARLAGFTFLFYIGVAFASIVLFNRATDAEGTAAKLARIAQHASDVRLSVLLSLLCCFSAVVLAVALYGITRDEDHELALLALLCRVGEGLCIATFSVATMGLLRLATATGASAADAAATNALGELLLEVNNGGGSVSAILFSVGSTLFAWLLLRGRMVPVLLAWLGVFASLLLVVLVPAQFAGYLHGAVLSYIWIPALVFEVTLALWLLIKGVALPETRYSLGAAT